MVPQALEVSDLKFLLSNPPHDDVDPVRAASIFGQTTAEARMKLNFPGADVWFVEEDECQLADKVAELRSIGARAAVTSGRMIASLSERLELRGFALRDDVLELDLGRDEPLRVPYSWTVHSVICRPMDQGDVGRRLTMRQAAKAASPNKSSRQLARTNLAQIRNPIDESFVDLYFTDGPTTLRATMWAGRTEYSGLGDRKKISQRENIEALIGVLTERFRESYDDRRLENAPLPGITLLGRRTLRGHLEVVHPSLKNIDEYDLLSRLAFLAAAAGGR